MRSERALVRLGDHVELATGYPFKSNGYTTESGAIKLLRGDNVAQGVLRWEDAKRWPASDTQTVQMYVLREDDVVLAMDRPWISAGLKFAHVRRTDLPCLLVQRVARLRAKQGLDSRFLRYIVGSKEFTDYILSVQTGTAVPHISANQIAAFRFVLPPIEEQQEVGELLGALDDRIDFLRQTNSTLESIAQALFKSWFIDFDPVRAKAEGREPEGMDTATAALFPAGFEESALGLIPKGWTVRSLDSFATYLNGLALQKYPAESEDEYLPVIKIAQLRAGHTNGSDRASARLKPEYVVRDGDVLFSWSGSLEVELWCGGEGALNQHLFKVTSSEVPKWFYYLATKHFLPGFRETAAHKATTMGHIQRGHLTASRLALPPAPVMRALSSVMGPLLERRISGALQARELAAVRDSLLPRLVSGRLRLPEAVEAAEAAAA